MLIVMMHFKKIIKENIKIDIEIFLKCIYAENLIGFIKNIKKQNYFICDFKN